MKKRLLEIASLTASPVERRLLAEYGAVFLTKATAPPVIIFQGPEQVEQFQSTLPARSGKFGEHILELQEAAMGALLLASSEAAGQGLGITARAADAGRRSYEDTVRLWNRNVTRGLEHWQSLGRIAADRAQSIRSLPAVEQVAIILEMEEAEQLYFGTFFDRSILYSVAAPGASQHLSMLAFDVAEFQDEAVEKILGQFGWFRTVLNDFPHFTYLGHKKEELPGLGLKQVTRDYSGRGYSFWIPDLDGA